MGSEPLDRKLAAILYADVAGYSRLTGEDEDATHRTLSEYLDLISETVESQRGRVMHYAGDAVLAKFNAAVDALSCAAAIQSELRARNQGLPDQRQVQFRIGVNLGDVIEDRGDIYGEGVNVAARLQSLAEPGGICISESVRIAIGKKLPLEYEFLGAQQVKNIADPVRAYRVRLENEAGPRAALTRSRWVRRAVVASVAVIVLGVIVGGIAWLTPWHVAEKPTPAESMKLASQDSPSIAVLPFTNMSGNAEQEYFVDGITEDLITELSKVAGLLVIARTSTFAYKGQSPDLRQLGQDLNVRYVLEGSVRKASDRLRITAQLIDASNGYHLWAERYDRNLSDVFALQDEITREIVSALRVKLSGGERQSLVRRYTDSVEAYDFFLRGREQFAFRTKEGALNAQALYEKAIALDLNFAQAYSMLAWTHARMFLDGWSEFPENSLGQAYELARKAIEVDDSQPLGYFVLGLVQMFRKKHVEAIAEAEKAIVLNPNYADGYALLALSLNYGGKPKEGRKVLAKGMRLSPHDSSAYLTILGQSYFISGDYDEAIKAFRRALERNPSAQRPHTWLAAAYAQAGNMHGAQWEADQILTWDPDFSSQRLQQTTPLKDPADLHRFLDGLRKAGLPE